MFTLTEPREASRRPVASADELVVLCGADGAATGVAPKALVHTHETLLHLAFSCYLFDPVGRVLVTRRATTKGTFPGVRTNSCCGHPAPGETMAAAIARRVRFELGMTPSAISLMLPGFRYRAVAGDGTVENELCPVYRAVVDEPARPCADEVADAWWMPWPDFVEGAGDVSDPLSAWASTQVQQLAALGPDPYLWPVADPALLPAAVAVEAVPA